MSDLQFMIPVWGPYSPNSMDLATPQVGVAALMAAEMMDLPRHCGSREAILEAYRQVHSECPEADLIAAADACLIQAPWEPGNEVTHVWILVALCVEALTERGRL